MTHNFEKIQNLYENLFRTATEDKAGRAVSGSIVIPKRYQVTSDTVNTHKSVSAFSQIRITFLRVQSAVSLIFDTSLFSFL